MIDTSTITEAEQMVTTGIQGDVDTLKGYFEDTQMLDLDGSGPTEVASAITTKTELLSHSNDFVSKAVHAAEVINGISVT